MTSIAKRRKALEKRREEVRDQHRRLQADRRRDADQPERISTDLAFEAATDAVLDRLESSTLAELGRIEHAISHLDCGRGNSCECCGRTIDHKRLLTVVHATQCRTCARALVGVAGTQYANSVLPRPMQDGQKAQHPSARPARAGGPTGTRA